MLWRGRRRSGNIEDRRGIRAGRGVVGGGIGTLVVVLLAWTFGIDPRVVMQGVGTTNVAPATGEPYAESAREAEWREFTAVTLGYTEDAWKPVFAGLHGEYREPGLAFFTGVVETGCGGGEAAAGPFYCPADEHIFIDLSFYDQLENQPDVAGDFPRAYVIAHEVGHHVQKLLGTSDRVRELRQRVGEIEGNQLSVRLELQADCYAGLWTRRAQDAGSILEPGDIDEALDAVSAIGDDTLQRNAGRAVVPDSFTHGSAAQRQRWFGRGYDTARFDDCDTFKEADL